MGFFLEVLGMQWRRNGWSGDGSAVIVRPPCFDLCEHDSIGCVVLLGQIMAVACSKDSCFLRFFWVTPRYLPLVPFGLTPWGAGFVRKLLLFLKV